MHATKQPEYVKKKPVVVRAMRMPEEPHNVAEAMDVYHWIENNTLGSFDVNDPDLPLPESGVSISASTGLMVIATLEGPMTVSLGDYVIQGVKGEFYPIKPDIYAETYEPATFDDVCRARLSESWN